MVVDESRDARVQREMEEEIRQARREQAAVQRALGAASGPMPVLVKRSGSPCQSADSCGTDSE